MARTTFHRLTAVPGNPKLVPVQVDSAYEPGVYRLDNGRVRYALVKSPGAALTIVTEATAVREARLLMDDAAQDIDAALALAAPAPVTADTLTVNDIATLGHDVAAQLVEPDYLMGLLLMLAVIAPLHEGRLADGTPDERLARGILIRDGEDWDVGARPFYIARDGGFQPSTTSREFFRVDNEHEIAGRGLKAVPDQNRVMLSGLDAASFDGRIVYRDAFSSGRWFRTKATPAEIRDGAPAWAWRRDDCVVGIRFGLPEVTGFRAGGTAVHSHDGALQLTYRAFVEVEGFHLFSAPIKVGKKTKNLRGKIDAARVYVDGLVEAAQGLATALDAARTIDAEPAAILVATKVLGATGDKLSETIADLHERASTFSPSLGGVRYVLAAAFVQDSTQPRTFSAWYGSVASERTSEALAVLATECARRKADAAVGGVAMIEEVKRIEARMPKLEGDAREAATATRRFAILSALRAVALFPRDTTAEVDAFGDRAEGTAHKATPVRLLVLRAVFGTMATDARALDAEWWTGDKVRDNALQIMLDATGLLVTEGDAKEGGAS